MKSITWRGVAIGCALVLAAWTAGPDQAFAEGKHGVGIVKERHEAMERFEELVDRMFAMLHGELPYSAEAVKKAAAEIKAGAGDRLVKMFPEGTVGKPSEAKPLIWQEMDFFTHLADRLADFAAVLERDADIAPQGVSFLPKKWEDVPVMGAGGPGGPGGMMGQGPGWGSGAGPGRGMGPGMMGRGMMAGPGPGMMGGGGTVESDLWHVAHVCNTCHARYREDD